jgi:hypothetical protein
MTKDSHKYHKRFVYLSGLAFLLTAILVLLIGSQSLFVSVVLVVGLIAIYSLERWKIGIAGHIAVILASLGTLFVFNLQNFPLFSNIRAINPQNILSISQMAYFLMGIVLFFLLMGGFIGGYVIFGITTIQTGIVPAFIGYLLILVPINSFITDDIRKFIFAGIFLIIGYLLMTYVSYGDYDENVPPNSPKPDSQKN